MANLIANFLRAIAIAIGLGLVWLGALTQSVIPIAIAVVIWIAIDTDGYGKVG